MKYSSMLLKKFISVNDTPENIAKNLILKTCEIEEVHVRVLPDDLVIGKIKEFKKHPEADKLNICQVDCGKKWMFEIICGGENVAENMYVPVALPNCFLPAINMKIEPRKMRGILSNGMICSKEEIGVKEDLDKHRIRSLVEDFDDIGDEDLGISLKQKYPRMEWYVMEVDNKSLTNRPDLTGHFGIAAELNAMYAYEGPGIHGTVSVSFNKVVDLFKQFQNTNILETLENSTKLERKVVSKSDGLNTYILLALNNITVQQSSFFMRLQTIDMWSQPINNWVDFSNLFMLISGQPIHFFDADKVDGDIIVRNAKEGEEFVDLFEKKHSLLTTDIVISDKHKILALAGVMWWLESWVSDTTKNILVEIANFDSVAVRKTWTRLGLRTDAELRYEKNINPVYSLYCLLLFLEELKYYQKDLWSYEIWGLDFFASKSVQKENKNEKIIPLHYEKMAEFIFGKKIRDLGQANQDFEVMVQKYLTGLWFMLNKKWDRAVPFRRSPDDITITEDLYEEVVRLYGYEKIPTLSLQTELKNTDYTSTVELTRTLEDLLVKHFACDQTETYPWVGEKILSEFGVDKESLYVLQNPVNPEMPYMRDDMIYGLLAHVARNSKFYDACKIFDIGKVWKKENKPTTPTKFASSFVHEQWQVGIMMYQKDIKSWEKDPILSAKSLVNILLKEVGLSGDVHFEKTEHQSYHPKKQANIVLNSSNIWFIWALHPLVLKGAKMPENAWVVYVSLDMDQILLCLKDSGERQYRYETLQDQIVYRDLCFVVDADKEFGWIFDAVKGVKEVKNIEVFDVYAWERLGEGKKSVAFTMKIVGDSNGMTTEQINEVMNKAIAAGEGAGGQLRG